MVLFWCLFILVITVCGDRNNMTAHTSEVRFPALSHFQHLFFFYFQPIKMQASYGHCPLLQNSGAVPPLCSVQNWTSAGQPYMAEFANCTATWKSGFSFKMRKRKTANPIYITGLCVTRPKHYKPYLN